MANQTKLFDNLADSVRFKATITPKQNPSALPDNDPSFVDLDFNTGSPTYYLNEFGVYDGFCIQPWIPISNREYSADLYYSTENFTISTLVDLDQNATVDVDEPFDITQDTVQESVYTLNNLTWANMDGDDALEGIITDDNGNILNPTDGSGNTIYLEVADVQYLIWYQIYGLYAPDYGPGFDESDYGPRALNSAQNAALAASIAPFAANYVPDEAGEKVGLIFEPNAQYLPSIIHCLLSSNHKIFCTSHLPL